MRLTTVALGFCAIFLGMVVISSSWLSPPAAVARVNKEDTALAGAGNSSDGQETTTSSPGDRHRGPLRYIVPIEVGGGLSNQRSLMLFTLMTAVHWGVRDVLLSNALLKIPNIQVFLPLQHRYLAPYDSLKLYVFNDSLQFLKRHPQWIYAAYAGTYEEMWDEDVFRRVAAEFGLTVWKAPFGGFVEYEMNRVLDEPVRNVRMSQKKVVPFVSWDRFWADKDVLFSNASLGLVPFAPRVEPKAVDEALQAENFTLAMTNQRTALMVDLARCFRTPLCMSLARAFEPSPRIVKSFVEPLMRLLPKTFVAVHYREFMCDRTFRGVSQLLPHLARLIQQGKLPGIAKVPTPREGNETSVGDDRDAVTLYMSTAVEAREFWPLTQAGYRVVNKETLLDMTVLHYPFEVMALVDQEVCRRAPHFVTLTIPKGTPGPFSTFSAFVDLYRNLSNRGETHYLGDCFSIAGKKKPVAQKRH